jgi:DNA-binding MurR/RpiR family transcriptional regulator
MPDHFLTRVQQAAGQLEQAKAELHRAILEAHATAHSTIQIAKAAGMTQSTVYRLIHAED